MCYRDTDFSFLLLFHVYLFVFYHVLVNKSCIILMTLLLRPGIVQSVMVSIRSRVLGVGVEMLCLFTSLFLGTPTASPAAVTVSAATTTSPHPVYPLA